MRRLCGDRLLDILAVSGIVALVTIGGRPARAAAPKQDGDRWAVLVGVDDYTLAAKLQFCGSDQRALRERLVAAGFPGRQVFLLDDSAKENRYRPSKGNIERQVASVLRTAAEGDVVVLGFSGHGTEIDRKMYLVPGDGDPAEPASLVSLDQIYEQLRGCPASVKLVIVDACRNDLQRGAKAGGSAAGARALAASLEKRALPEGVVLLNSCAPGEISWEEEKFGHGVFMHYVLEGLDGKAEADGDCAVSLNELAKYAARETKSFVLNERSVTQRPYLRNEGEADLLDFALLPVAAGGGAKPAGRRPGEVVENSLGMKLVVIPAGEFQMGSDETDDSLRQALVAAEIEPAEGAFTAGVERPVHKVRITKPFRIGVHEVTLGQFLNFYHDGYQGKLDCEKDEKGGWGYDAKAETFFVQKPEYRPWHWGHPGQTNDHPAVNVSWNDAVAFCQWLSKKERKQYRLPTEAEWEYACRAGSRSRYWFGDNFEALARYDNVGDQTGKDLFDWLNNIKSRDGFAFTAPVGSYSSPNPFGLQDVHGNVKEWCSDRYDENYYQNSPASDPQGPNSTGKYRVQRGGAWGSIPCFCRSSIRLYFLPSTFDLNLGFRVVCELE